MEQELYRLRNLSWNRAWEKRFGDGSVIGVNEVVTEQQAEILLSGIKGAGVSFVVVPRGLVLESKEGFVFGSCADFASVYSSLKRLEIRGDIVIRDNAEDEVVFVPRGCKVVCNNAEFIKHVRER